MEMEKGPGFYLWSETGRSSRGNRPVCAAMMLLFFLLQLSVGLRGEETLCTSDACFTLHLKKVGFDRAEQDCRENGGYLVTVRSSQEERVLRSLLSAVPPEKNMKLWIGLKLHRRDCVRSDEPLKGFRWTSGEETSLYSNWREEPEATCTEQRCVSVSLSDALRWSSGGCRRPVSYACTFYFKGMCRPLALSGPGNISYTAPFSKEPQTKETTTLPLGTYADVECEDGRAFYSVCAKAEETSGWNRPGPFCGPRCEVGNGGCQHRCRQSAEGAECVCGDGYELERDGRSCRRRNACAHASCQYRCVAEESGFSCRCPDGFVLDENQRNCSDVDECAEAACAQVCTNTAGSFFCSCRDGFTLSRDGFTCVDECGNSQCQTETAVPSVTASPRQPQETTPTDSPSPRANASQAVNATVLVCVLGSALPLLLLVAVTLLITVCRYNASKREAEKKASADGYCWVSSGLDPRLEKLYESVPTDDL